MGARRKHRQEGASPLWKCCEVFCALVVQQNVQYRWIIYELFSHQSSASGGFALSPSLPRPSPGLYPWPRWGVRPQIPNLPKSWKKSCGRHGSTLVDRHYDHPGRCLCTIRSSVWLTHVCGTTCRRISIRNTLSIGTFGKHLKTLLFSASWGAFVTVWFLCAVYKRPHTYLLITRAINVSEMTRSLRRHNTMQSREATLEEVSLQTTAECGQRRYGCTCCGRPFQTWAAATRKALSPMIDRRVRRTTSDDDDAERKRRRALKSADWRSSSAKYDGATLCKHLYTRTASLKSIRSATLSQCSWRRKHQQLCQPIPFHTFTL